MINTVSWGNIEFTVDASDYVKVWVSTIPELPWRVEVVDESGAVVASGDVHRDKPLVYDVKKKRAVAEEKPKLSMWLLVALIAVVVAVIILLGGRK